MSARARRGYFLTFEGIEGSGKSSGIAALARALRRAGRHVLVTREPGGTKAGERIRSLFLGPGSAALTPWTELFLMEAARSQHLAKVVRPALAAGRVVLCDRFTDSTVAYQGYGRGLPVSRLRALHRQAALGPAPDLTFLFDLPVRPALERTAKRNALRRGARGRESRLDDEPEAFHERVRRGYLAIARAEPGRIVRVRADEPPAAIAAFLREILARRLGLE